MSLSPPGSLLRFTAGLIIGLLVTIAPLGAVPHALADGTDWVTRSTTDQNWYSVAYGDGLWVAVANDGEPNSVMTSEDGETWTPRPAVDGLWTSVAYGDDLWVAVGSTTDAGHAVMTSPDGINWSPQGDASVGSGWMSVAYGNGRWVAVRDYGENNDGLGLKRVMTSTDGINWTLSDAAAELSWRSVAYGGGRWVAVANNLVPKSVMTSENGIDWTLSASADDSSRWDSVAYGSGSGGGGLWVAVAYDGPERVMTSSNGTTWTSQTPAAALAWDSVAYGGGLWVAVARSGDGNRVMTSLDGTTWTSQTSAANNFWKSVAYGDGLWAAVAITGSEDRVMTTGEMTFTGDPPAGPARATPLELTCEPSTLMVGEETTCTVTGGDPGIDILWRASYGTVLAEAGVTLDDAGSGQFSFVVPAAAAGRELTVELVDWLAPLSLGVVGGPVPTSVPSGEGPALPGWLAMVGLVALAGAAVAARRGQVVAG